MDIADPVPVSIEVEGAISVSGLLQPAQGMYALFVFGHGAGAGMQHPFMAECSRDLASYGVATLRYQFPYMEKRGKRPDPPAVCQATVRAAVDTARRLEPTVALIAGGKSFGGRMTSQAQAQSPLPGVQGLAFFGFPLHPPKQPSDARAEHLAKVRIPMLFLQGDRDEFADGTLLLPLIERLGANATLKLFGDADHSFHVRARTGRTDGQIRAQMLESMADWTRTLVR